MLNLLRDIRIATRTLLRGGGMTVLAVLTLTLGIGATTAIYTVFKRILLDPLPYPAADRLVRLKNQVPGVAAGEEWHMSAAQYFHLRENATSIEEIGAYNAGELSVDTPTGPEAAMAALVSPGTLSLIGARAALGRSLTDSDDVPGSPPVAVLSHGFWERRFGADPDVVGGTLVAFGLPIEIIGVLEPGPDLPQEPGAPRSEPIDFWIPLGAIDTRFNPDGPFYANHTTPMIARLAAGASPEAAQEELDRLTRLLPEAFPEAYSAAFFERYGLRSVMYPLKGYTLGNMARPLWVVMGVAALVLLVACTNVANLFLVRLEGRSREMAVRSALGADRVAIARQLFAEGLVLATLAGALALLIAAWGTRGLTAIAPDTMPRLDELEVGIDIVLATIGLVLAVACMVSVPAFGAGRTDPRTELADGGRGGTVSRGKQRTRSIFVVAQVAMALVLTIGAALLVESFVRLRAVDPGIRAEGVISVPLRLNPQNYEDIPSMWRFYDQVLARVEALPGVSVAGMSQELPLTGGFGCTVQGFEDQTVHQRITDSGSTTCAGQEPTTPGYFETLGIPLLRGRLFTDADNEVPSAGAVVVSQAFAERFWPGEDPIGKGVAPGGRREAPFYRVVGVVGDVFSGSPVEEPATVIYYPIVRIPESSGWTPNQMNLVVRTNSAQPLDLLPQIREVVQRLDPSIPVESGVEMEALVDRSTSVLSFSMTLITLAAGIAVLLAAVGLYGVMTYVVSRRTGEIGIRMAIGARAAEVERLVLGGSLKVVAIGLGLGLGGALLVTQLLRGLLYGVEPADLSAYVASSVLLLVVGALATYVPARRAARVDPVVALRGE